MDADKRHVNPLKWILNTILDNLNVDGLYVRHVSPIELRESLAMIRLRINRKTRHRKAKSKGPAHLYVVMRFTLSLSNPNWSDDSRTEGSTYVAN